MNLWSRYNDQIGNIFVQMYPQSYLWEGVGIISGLDLFTHSLIHSFHWYLAFIEFLPGPRPTLGMRLQNDLALPGL